MAAASNLFFPSFSKAPKPIRVAKKLVLSHRFGTAAPASLVSRVWLKEATFL